MPPRKTLVASGLAVVVIHAALFSLWPIVGASYGHLFRFGARGVAAIAGAMTASEVGIAATGERRDTELRVSRRAGGPLAVARIDSRFTGYLPSSLMLALAIATPVAWRLRLRIAFAGLLAIGVFIGARLACSIFLLGARPATGDATPGSLRLLTVVETVLGHVASSTTLVPLCIWILLFARWGSWRGMGPTLDKSSARAA
jgi:hypothetical protein